MGGVSEGPVLQHNGQQVSEEKLGRTILPIRQLTLSIPVVTPMSVSVPATEQILRGGLALLVLLRMTAGVGT